MGVISSRLFDCPTLKNVLFWANNQDEPYTVDYAWNFAELYTGNSVSWSYYAVYAGASTDVSYGKPVRRFSHYGSTARMCPVMESGQGWYFDMAGGWGDATVTSTIMKAPHLKALNQIFYDGHAASLTASDYAAYFAQPIASRSYPFYYRDLPTK